MPPQRDMKNKKEIRIQLIYIERNHKINQKQAISTNRKPPGRPERGSHVAPNSAPNHRVLRSLCRLQVDQSWPYVALWKSKSIRRIVRWTSPTKPSPSNPTWPPPHSPQTFAFPAPPPPPPHTSPPNLCLSLSVGKFSF